jgi:hypothetical protein
MLIAAAVVLASLGAVGVAIAGHDAAREAAPATARFHDIDAARAAGYTVQVFDKDGITCIASDAGAMGIHMLNPSLLDEKVEATQPELLVYEPRDDGTLKLVALEYLVFQAAWLGQEPPELFGQTFDLVPDPNRYGLPAFYALHAWIWKPNPSGLFFAWNPSVDCG